MQPALMLYSPLLTLKSLQELDKLQVQQAPRRVLLSTSRRAAHPRLDLKRKKKKSERQSVTKTRARQKNERQ